MTTQNHLVQDPESGAFMQRMLEQEKVRSHRVPHVKSILVVLSAAGMVFDVEALKQKILLTYSDAAVFFQTTDGKAIGTSAPEKVDLLIDFTGPNQRQGLFYARRLRRAARFAIGRNAGIFRKKIYNRVFDEKKAADLPGEILSREREVQKQVLALAGVPFVQAGDTPPDRGKITPLELPPLARDRN
jgi:hypothetical protein